MSKYMGEKKGEHGKQKQPGDSNIGNRQGTTQTGGANNGGQRSNDPDEGHGNRGPRKHRGNK